MYSVRVLIPSLVYLVVLGGTEARIGLVDVSSAYLMRVLSYGED